MGYRGAGAGRCRLVPGGLPITKWAAEDGVDDEALIDRILEEFDQHMAAKAAQIGADTMRMAERQITLQVLDQLWREHIQNMMRLREGVTLRAFGQRDPLAEYRRDGFEMFDGLLDGTEIRWWWCWPTSKSVSLNHHSQHRLLPRALLHRALLHGRCCWRGCRSGHTTPA